MNGRVNARRFVRSVQKRIARPEFVSLVSTDGEDSYIGPVRKAFKSACFVQVVKKRKGYKLESISARVLTGESMEYVESLFKKLGIGSKPNTSFVERVNGTTRSLCSDLIRRTHAFAKWIKAMIGGLIISCALYNFVKPHRSLKDIFRRTPAMAAGLIGHPVSWVDILYTRV